MVPQVEAAFLYLPAALPAEPDEHAHMPVINSADSWGIVGVLQAAAAGTSPTMFLIGVALLAANLFNDAGLGVLQVRGARPFLALLL